MSDHTTTGVQQIERALEHLRRNTVRPIPTYLSQRLGDPDVWHAVLDLIAEHCRLGDDIIAHAHYLLTRYHHRPFHRTHLTGIAEARR